MAKEKMVFFRTAIGGFNRDDVNNYIEKLNAEFADRERTAKRKLDVAESKCADLAEKNTALENTVERLSKLEAEADARERLLAEYIEKIEAQENEIELLRSSNASAENEKSELSAMIESLSDAISKSEKYDGLSGQIGEIILSARSTAEEIITKATKDAENKRADTDALIENAAASFNARAATAAYAIKGHIKKLANESYSALAEKATETSELLRDLAAHISLMSEDFDSAITNGKFTAENAIESEAAKIFADINRLSVKK